MVAVNQIAVNETRFVYTTEGVDRVRAQNEQVASSLTKVAAASDKATDAEGKAASSSDKAAQARAKLAAVQDRFQRQMQAEAQILGMAQSQQDALTAATERFADAQTQAARSASTLQGAANDNVGALERQGEAFKAAGKFALEHPILVAAGSVAAARALSGLAASAAGSLAAASAVTARYAATSTEMGTTAAAGAALAARGLSGLSTGAAAAAVGLETFATKAAGLTTTTSLLSRALSLVPGYLLPIAVAFAAFEVASSAINKAYADLNRLIALGEKARNLDVGAPFLKSFEALGPKIGTTADQIDSALSKASSFLRDSWGSGNALSKLFNDITATGAAGAGGLQATALSDTATTIEERIRAALVGMKELDDLGLHLASLQIGEKVFGPEVADRLRTGQTTAAQILADLDAATQKEVLKQEQVDRALTLNKQISDTKQAISDAWAVTVDFSGAALLLNEAWLKILQAVRWIVDTINDAITAVGNFASAVAAGIGGAFDAVSNKVTGLLTQMGVLSAQQKAASTELPQIDGSYGPQQPTITARQFPYTFGPTAPTYQQATAGAKQAKQAAQEAVSSYDNLIRRTKDRIEELDLETKSVGQSSDAVIKLKLAHDMERAAKKDGITVTQQMRDETDRLGTSLAASTEHLANAKRQLELTKEAQRELGDTFGSFAEDMILGGQKMSEAFSNLAKTLASSSLKALLTGQGGLAGLFGTAGEKSGDLGGLLGGKLSLGSLFGGGSSSEAGSPLPGAQGPSLPSSSLFGGLFDGNKITKALGLGAESGIGSALSNALKPKGNGGILSSPLGGAIASVGAGAAIGYSSQSPLMGALGGGLAGLASGNALLAVAGAGAGLLGGLFGQSEAKKEAKKKLQQEIQARREALDQARPQIEQLSLTFQGGSIGNVGKQISDALTQAKQAIKTASDGGDQALADKLMKDYQTYVARMTATFADGFNGVLAEVQAGFGTSGPFSQAMASVQQLGEAIKGFVADAGRISPAATAAAQTAAVKGALAALQPTPNLSATQTELARINGTAAGLTQVLKDLGLSADQAAAAIKDGTNKALDSLRTKFSDDLGRKINDALNKGYLNDASDLLKEVASLQDDASAIGGDLGQVDTYFTAAAQKIVDGSQLAGGAFDELIAKFPELAGRVREYSATASMSADQAAKAAQEALSAIQDRMRGYEDRYVAATFETDSLSGKLLAFDRNAEWERWQEGAKGNQAILQLEQAQGAERLKIITDFAKAATEALNARLKGYADRLFAATNDTSTLGGQLAAYDRQAQQEREDEVKAGGQALAQLEQTQYAERLKIITDFQKQAAEAAKQQLAAAQTAFETFVKNIKTYLDNLRSGAASPLSPKDRLAAAQSQYGAQLALAKSGDRTALDSITQYSDALLEASKAYNASGSAYQATFQQILADLEALPKQVSAEQFIVDAINDSKDAIVSATEAMRASLLAGLQANSPPLIATALLQNFEMLDTSVNGLLSPDEFLAGLGPLATQAEQQQARVIFNAIDTNGDGQLSRLELQNASSQRVEQYTAATNDNVGSSNVIATGQQQTLDQQSGLLNSINNLTNSTLETQQQLVNLNSSINSQNAFIQANTAYTNQALAQQSQYQGDTYLLQGQILNNLRSANAKNGAPVYATGGWVNGPGTGTSDSIWARVSNREFVVNAAAARQHGPLLEAINDNAGISMPALAMPMPVVTGGGSSNEALIAEVRALRAELAAVKAAVKENTQVAEAGHLGTMGAVRSTTAAVQDGNATASRATLAKKVR
ncbi:EF-hand domain-containing protein [Methylobacterium sp. NMS12]|uniref:EF-hand domain-containing protein n=1 Tax=Methylobacterium sp. NMS12 TaxID=3079766 RepID=UPI003F880405